MMPDLPDLLQSLPPELYDRIYTLTFTSDAIDITIDRSYRPPAIHAVDRASRALALKSFYSNSHFRLDGWAIDSWVVSLEIRHSEAAQIVYGGGRLRDYQTQLLVLEAQKKRRILDARRQARNTLRI